MPWSSRCLGLGPIQVTGRVALLSIEAGHTEARRGPWRGYPAPGHRPGARPDHRGWAHRQRSRACASWSCARASRTVRRCWTRLDLLGHGHGRGHGLHPTSARPRLQLTDEVGTWRVLEAIPYRYRARSGAQGQAHAAHSRDRAGLHETLRVQARRAGADEVIQNPPLRSRNSSESWCVPSADPCAPRAAQAAARRFVSRATAAGGVARGELTCRRRAPCSWSLPSSYPSRLSCCRKSR